MATDPAAPDSSPPAIDAAMEQAVGISVGDLSALLALSDVKNLGPQKFKEIHASGSDAVAVLREPSRLPTTGKRGDELRAAIADLTRGDLDRANDRAARAIAKAFEFRGRILTYRSVEYPRSVYESNNPVEVLYVLGPPALLARPAVACVGSRGIRDPYADAHASFARVAAGENVAVASGFATGADRIGHEAAWDAGGTTVCVMPCGLDRPFPPENRDLWAQFLASDRAVFVSEFPFGTGASSLTLRKRNKLIVAFAAGVLISQSSEAGGAMNAFRFAVEQRKPIATFEPDDTDATSGNRLIAAETKVPVRVLPAADEMAMSAWLQTLSFST